MRVELLRPSRSFVKFICRTPPWTDCNKTRSENTELLSNDQTWFLYWAHFHQLSPYQISLRKVHLWSCPTKTARLYQHSLAFWRNSVDKNISNGFKHANSSHTSNFLCIKTKTILMLFKSCAVWEKRDELIWSNYWVPHIFLSYCFLLTP